MGIWEDIGEQEMNLREMAEAWLRANDWDYKKYGDRRSDRSAYDGLMNYEISSLLEEVYIAGAQAILDKVRPVLEFYGNKGNYIFHSPITYKHERAGFEIVAVRGGVAQDDGIKARALLEELK